MAGFKHVPELVRINGKWTIEPFEPTQPAFDWNKLRGKTATLYVMKCGDYCKIGMTTNLQKRLISLDLSNPLPVTLAGSRTVPQAGLAYAEAWMYKKFSEHRVKREWFALDAKIALKALPAAVVRAKAYATCCAQWFAAECTSKRTPERRAKAEREYANFVEKMNRNAFASIEGN